MSDERPSGLYSVHPAVKLAQKLIIELSEKTGRSLDAWLTLIRAYGPFELKDRREWLQSEFNLGRNTASFLAERAGADATGIMDDSPEGYLAAAPLYVDAIYSGPKAALRPIHDRLLTLGFSLGGDVKACPAKTMTPIYRNHVIATITAATRQRVDFGLALKDESVTGRLIDTGGRAKKDRITHRIAITSPDEIDDEVATYLRIAYRLDE